MAGVAILVGVAVYVATVWSSEPPTLPVKGAEALNSFRANGLNAASVSYENVSASGTQMELAILWQGSLPNAVLPDVDYGWQAILLIVSATTAGPFVAHYSIVDPGVSTSCGSALGGSSCSDELDFFDAQSVNGTLLFHAVWSYGCACATVGASGNLTVDFALSVTPVVLVGPIETTLPAVAFHHSEEQEFEG